MKHLQKHLSASLIALAALLAAPMAAWAAPAPSLGTASSFAVLSAAPNAGGAVSCTTSTVNGDVGSSGAMASVVNVGCTINGAVVAPVSASVLNDFNSAYNQYTDTAIPAIACTDSLNAAYTGTALVLPPGVYCNVGHSDTEAGVTFTNTTVTLDGTGVTNPVWIFKISGAGGLTSTDSSVVLTAAQPCDVTWWVDGAAGATVTRGDFQGTILAGSAITMTGNAVVPTTTSFNGNALAGAAVTMTDVTVNSCNATGGGNGHHNGHDNDHERCNQGVGNGPEDCDPGNSNLHNPFRDDDDARSNDEDGGSRGDPGRKGGNHHHDD